MRIACIKDGIVDKLVEGELPVVRALYPAHDCTPIDDFSAAEPGAAATVLGRSGGQPRRCRFTRADGLQTTETGGRRE